MDIFLYGWRKPRHDKMVPKRQAVLAFGMAGNSMDLEEVSRKKSARKGELTWGDPAVYHCPPLKETQRAGFDLVFSDHL
ncbi:unnamed protein product [Darwinula stevensoni]|uniref:Uncharacterized protein n=1 Tax=Darwinula stevensoni TaxID=69355 RepID=A0A7R9A931_9CRUS|nr:unnamed protein product [Darwinula stevensoni]CAG0897005.1 unnamed protein product [Darwinula stevensoni]